MVFQRIEDVSSGWARLLCPLPTHRPVDDPTFRPKQAPFDATALEPVHPTASFADRAGV